MPRKEPPKSAAKGQPKGQPKARPAAVKSAGVRSPGGRPTATRRTGKTAADAPGAERPLNGEQRPELNPEEVYRLIQETAYYKAKARGFAPGGEVQDWIDAEQEVRMRLEGGA